MNLVPCSRRWSEARNWLVSLFLIGGMVLPCLIGRTCQADDNLPKTITNSVGMKFVLIPAGEFVMNAPGITASGGQPKGNSWKQKIEKPFYLSVNETTQEQFWDVMQYNPASNVGATLPVEQLEWEAALAFCRRLGDKEGQSYRLPTSAEWEFACRAGTTTRYHFGAKLTTDQANFNPSDKLFIDPTEFEDDEESPLATMPVGSFAPNAFGLYDMHGNVSEWCLDLFPSGNHYHVVRGGSFASPAAWCRSATQRRSTSQRTKVFGFRVMRTVEPDEAFQTWGDPATSFFPQRAIARINEAFDKPAIDLLPGVVIFPPLDEDDRIVKHGRLIRLLASTASVYLPQKQTKTSVETEKALFVRPPFGTEGSIVRPEDIDLFARSMDAELYAVPRLLPGDQPGQIRLVVNFHGDGKMFLDQSFEHEIPIGSLVEAPSLIAKDVHAFLGNRLSPAELEFIAKQQLHEEADFVSLEELIAKKVKPGSPLDIRHIAFLRRHLDSIVGWDLYLSNCLDPYRALFFADKLKEHLPSGQSKIAWSSLLFQSGRFREAMDMMLDLAPRYRGDTSYHHRLGYFALGFTEDEIVDHLYKISERENPDYSGTLDRGKMLLDWAQDTAEGRFAHLAQENQFALSQARQNRALQELEAAAEINPDDWAPHIDLIKLATRIGLEQDFAERHFQQAIAANPRLRSTYAVMHNYLAPRAYGSPDDLMRFAKQCAETGYWEEKIPEMFLLSIFELGFNSYDLIYNPKIFRSPIFWEGMSAYYANSKSYHPTERGQENFNQKSRARYILWGGIGGHHAKMKDAFTPDDDEYWDVGVFNDAATYYHIRDLVRVETSQGSEKLLAQIRVALAAGDLQRTETLLDSGINLDRETTKEIIRYRGALKSAHKLQSEGLLLLSPSEIMKTWTLYNGKWFVQGDKLHIHTVNPKSGPATLICPYGFSHADLTGHIHTLTTGNTFRIVAHTQSEMDSVVYEVSPSTHRVSLSRNYNTLIQAPGVGGAKAFYIRCGENYTQFNTSGDRGVQMTHPNIQTGGIAFEFPTSSQIKNPLDRQMMLSNLRIELLLKDAPLLDPFKAPPPPQSTGFVQLRIRTHDVVVKFRNKKTNHEATFTSKENVNRFEVEAGRSVVRVEKKGYEPFEKDINVTTGRDQYLNVSLKRLPPMVTTKLDSRDKRAVEWLLTVKGRASLWLGNRKYASVTPEKPTIPSGFFQLAGVTMLNNQLNSEGLSPLVGLKGIKGLSIRNTPIAAKHLASIAQLKTITNINFSGSEITDEGLRHLQNLDQITSLDLSDTQVTDAGLIYLKNMELLEHVRFNETAVQGDGLAHLVALPELKHIWLDDTNLTGSSFKHLAAMKQLSSLHLDNTPLTDADLQILCQNKNLTDLYLSNTRVTDVGLKYLNQLTSLRTLYIRDTRLTDAGLAHLRSHPSLSTIMLNKTAISDAGLNHLATIPQLSAVGLSSTKVTDAGIEQLKKALPKCRVYK